MKLRANYYAPGTKAFTLVEVLVASMLLGILILSLFGAFSSGINVVEAARENMRGTQILVQKMETIRLLTWPQTVNTAIATTNFTELYDPTATNSGARYAGSYIAAPAPADIPADYRADMRAVTVTIYWTNYFGSKPRIQSRQMQTMVARYGMQNYVYR